MYEFKFADIGEGITEGKVLKLMYQPGDEIKEGDSLFLVETDKVNAEIPSPVSGKIVSYRAKEGDMIHVGDVIVDIDDGKETNEPEAKTPTKTKEEGVKEGSAGVVGALEVSEEQIESSTEVEASKEPLEKKVLATPVARKMAKDKGIDITQIRGTGPVGRVMKEDILSFEAHEPKPEEDKKTGAKDFHDERGQIKEIPLSMLRKTIAKNMVLSKSRIPHAATMDDFEVSELVKFREAQKEMALQEGIKLTYMPFIIKAVSLCLKEFEMFNATFDEEKEVILAKKFYHIGIATDTPDGLIVPVIKNADQKSIFEIAKELSLLSQKAQERTLSLGDLEGSTFTITNYGAIGTAYGVPVIKYPETAILGVGKITKKPVVEGEEVVIRDRMPLSLCMDHRAVDGADAGRFLNRLRTYLAQPMLLLMA